MFHVRQENVQRRTEHADVAILMSMEQEKDINARLRACYRTAKR